MAESPTAGDRGNMKYYRDLRDIKHLTVREREALSCVTERFAFRVNEYYLSLIDWADPEDPIRRMVIPHADELKEWGCPDPSGEETYTVLPGLEHKYPSTVLLLVSNVCECICRYCFRKRIFMACQKELIRDIPAAVKYIASRPEITNVLLTGGDPLVGATRKLERIICELRKIDHVKIIRIGTRMPVFNPYRIVNDRSLADMISRYSLPDKRIYIMTHFSHSRELTEAARAALDSLLKAGAILHNQCPLIRGVNDDAETLAELFRQLSYAGVTPYYLFQCRPALGNYGYTVPIEQGYEIYEGARARMSGLAKSMRYVMSHTTGKVEIVARTSTQVYFKYHRATCDADSGRIVVCKSNPTAYWLDDYDEIAHPELMRYQAYGPD